MREPTGMLRIEFGHDAQREYLAELDAPLIETVDVPDRALGEHAVLVEGDEGSKRMRVEALGENHIGRTVPLEDAEWRLPIGHAFGRHFLRRLAEGERFGLREQIGRQKIMLLGKLAHRPLKADKVARDQLGSLVDQLIEGMLTVSAGLTPDDRAGLIGNPLAFEVNALA